MQKCPPTLEVATEIMNIKFLYFLLEKTFIEQCKTFIEQLESVSNYYYVNILQPVQILSSELSY